GLEEDRPAIGVLLQNQWGLSFISEARPPQTDGPCAAEPPTEGPCAEPCAKEPSPAATPLTTVIRPPQEDEENNSKLLLSCRHLVQALNYHSRGEWSNRILSLLRHKPGRRLEM
ncbi:hypothetical protein NL108_014734, partial [Boleophthalmus pectinirostris]